MNYILNNSGITVFHKGRQIKVNDSAHNYKAVIKAVQSGSDDALVDALNMTEAQIVKTSATSKGFTFKGETAILDGHEVLGPLAAKLARMASEGFDLDPFVLFVRNLRQNPSHSAVKELYDFLAYAELPITEDGHILAYKGVRSDFYSSTAGIMKLKKGTVNADGRIFNGVGEEIECERHFVDDDRRNECSNGLHVGSHNYAKTFSTATVVVSINPKDVVSVPLDCRCQKMRVSAYKVVCLYGGEITAAVVKADATPAMSEDQTKASKVAKTIERLSDLGGNITLKRVQSALPSGFATVLELRSFARKAGYEVAIDSNSPASIGRMIVLL